MIELLSGVVLGGLVSWVISHFYYKRSSTQVPDWAKPLIEKLPDAPISTQKLIELYHEALEGGELRPDPMSGYVACPRCGASSDDFKPWEAGDPSRDMLFRGVSCGKCGYEVSSEEV